MDNVIPFVTEGLIEICEKLPEDPTELLANFLLKKSEEKIEKEKAKMANREIKMNFQNKS